MPPSPPPPPPLQDVVETPYKGLVRPILEYASPVRDPHGIVVQENLEKAQKCVARFVTSIYIFETGSMTSILEQLGWVSIHKRRKSSKLILLSKGLKGSVMTFIPQIGALGTSIQGNFKCHMLELTSTVSSQTPPGVGMHSLHL